MVASGEIGEDDWLVLIEGLSGCMISEVVVPLSCASASANQRSVCVSSRSLKACIP
jgi:hypothetical protein